MAELKLSNFSGLIPRLHRRNLPESVPVKALDVDLSNRTLKPFRLNKPVSNKTGQFIYVDDCCFITSDNCKASVDTMETECKIVVATGIKDYPVQNLFNKACAGEWVRIGFPETTKPSAQSLNFSPKPHTSSSGDIGDFAREVRQYYYTLITCLGDGTACQESMPSLPSDVIDCHNTDDVVISGILTDAGDYKIDKVRIYCAVTHVDFEGKEQEGTFLEVGEIPFGSGTFVHRIATGYGEECQTEEYDNLPDHASNLQYCGNGQLAALVGCELWMSEPLMPHAWPESFRYGRFRGKPIRFLGTESVGYILTDSYPSIIEIESPCTLPGCRKVTNLEETHPIISYDSACVYNGSCFYATNDGIVMLSGTNSAVITSSLFSRDDWLAIAPWTLRGVVHDGYYYGFTDVMSFRFKVPDNIHEQFESSTLVELSDKPIAVCRSRQDKLMLAFNDGTYEFNAGDQWREFQWESKVYTAPGYTAFTAYKIVGDFTDFRVVHKLHKRQRDEMVDEHIIVGDHITYDNKPRRLRAGYSTINFSVEISGKGEVTEYHIASSVNELGGQ